MKKLILCLCLLSIVPLVYGASCDQEPAEYVSSVPAPLGCFSERIHQQVNNLDSFNSFSQGGVYHPAPVGDILDIAGVNSQRRNLEPVRFPKHPINRVIRDVHGFIYAPEAQKSPVGSDFEHWCIWFGEISKEPLKTEMYKWTYHDWMKYMLPLYKANQSYKLDSERAAREQKVQDMQKSLTYKNKKLYQSFLDESHALWKEYNDAVMLCRRVGLLPIAALLPHHVLLKAQNKIIKNVLANYIDFYRPEKKEEEALWDKYNAEGAFVKN